MKFGKGMADKAGRAMKNRTPDKMGRAMVKKMAMGGLPTMDDRAGRAMVGRGMAGRDIAEDRMGRAMAYKKGGKVKSGSSASKRADGVAHKGKTKGKMVKMMKGGYCG
jgi:hypothetical protein